MTSFYFERFGFCGRQITAAPRSDLGLVVVVPCFNEPDLTGSLEALWQCERPKCAVDVIVVINSAVNSKEEIRVQNKTSLEQMTQWVDTHADGQLRFHSLYFPDLPSKHAGVGLARKIGMDEAVRRFEEIGKPEGVIACFDADCRCHNNYLASLERHFRSNSRSPGCSVYFEHPLSGDTGGAMVEYELHLRYYVQGLRQAGFPYAHHTIGSCMAVRTEAYTMQGGMNKRRAGEDFYFLHKIMPLGNFTDLTETTVIPSNRRSARVPFGTGKAMRDHENTGQTPSYPVEAFLDLQEIFKNMPRLRDAGHSSSAEIVDPLPESVRGFLQAEGFEAALTEICANSSSEAAFQKRFFHWFNGFRVMKFVHHARDYFYGKRNVIEEARRLLLLKGHAGAEHISSTELLGVYRRLDRANGLF